MSTPEPPSAADRPRRVLIVGGGPAGLEALLALRDLAGDRVELTLLSADDELVYRPLSVAEPFSPGTLRRYGLADIVRDFSAELELGRLARVEGEGVCVLEDGRQLTYDDLVIGMGARAVPSVEGAVSFAGPPDVPAVQAVVDAVKAGTVGSVAFTTPSGGGWPFGVYELALQTAGAGDAEIHLVTPEQAPLAMFGQRASNAVRELLEDKGVRVHAPRYAQSPFADGTLSLRPGDDVLTVDRVVAMPRLHGPFIEGLPHDRLGFLEVDAHGRLHGVPHVYAAGDATSFPLKQGGLAAQQADAVARAIAADAGSRVEPEPFQPVLRGMLLTGSEPTYMRSDLSGRTGDHSEVAGYTLWWPPTKIAGDYLAPYLSGVDHAEATRLDAAGRPAAAVPVEVELEQREEPGEAPAVRRRWVLSRSRIDPDEEILVELDEG